MEIKINKDIRAYSEAVFFGLTLRQCIFSALAIAVAVGLYFLLKPTLGTETTSWVCILGAAPFAALGFVTYHGMTCEKFIWAWFRSELLEPKRLVFHPNNIYYEALKEKMWAAERTAMNHSQNTEQPLEAGPGTVSCPKPGAGHHTDPADLE